MPFQLFKTGNSKHAEMPVNISLSKVRAKCLVGTAGLGSTVLAEEKHAFSQRAFIDDLLAHILEV